MRTLCSLQVFDEVAPDTYAKNYTSAALVGNEPLRSYILVLFVLLPLSLSLSIPTNIPLPVASMSSQQPTTSQKRSRIP
jgi:hypothetical protein